MLPPVGVTREVLGDVVHVIQPRAVARQLPDVWERPPKTVVDVANDPEEVPEQHLVVRALAVTPELHQPLAEVDEVLVVRAVGVDAKIPVVVASGFAVEPGDVSADQVAGFLRVVLEIFAAGIGEALFLGTTVFWTSSVFGFINSFFIFCIKYKKKYFCTLF